MDLQSDLAFYNEAGKILFVEIDPNVTSFCLQDHREFLMELDSHKAVMMSINIIGGHLAEHSCNEQKALETSQRIEAINDEWDRACERATQWQTTLQTSLMQVRHLNMQSIMVGRKNY